MSSSPAPGTVFAEDYEIIRRLDSGGMGRVFLVLQRSTGRCRALKIMRSRLVDDPELRKRFAQEARIGSRIESEHVVEVVGAGVDAKTGLPWLAMEHLEGENLWCHVERRGALSPAELLRVLQQVCHALGAAHRVGIVHRDIKPENIFLGRARRADAAHTVKVLDFGLAKALLSATHSGTLAVGTPLFMAPEQYLGSAVSPQTDVWALGLLAFYLLTGRNYQRSAQTHRVDLRLLAREALRGADQSASLRARALGVATPLPSGFDWWFARCVARRPRERFPDAAVAFEQLTRALSRASLPAPLPPPRSNTLQEAVLLSVLTAAGGVVSLGMLLMPLAVAVLFV